MAAFASVHGGCAADDARPTLPAGSTLGGIIYYDGAAAAPGRPLAIALYRTFPPQGPPVATRLVEQYALPYTYLFEDLSAGDYYVGALIDVDRLDTRYAGMLNADRDPHGYAGGGAPVQVGEQVGAVGIDIPLADPR